ncbi:MAG TPA: alanine--glyoxylate aminotransferase family protein [Gemmatimonadales bacterium]|nr:alanine--glyoxylate aminotransferase family protein [Gemmatimonadales bacterium]
MNAPAFGQFFLPGPTEVHPDVLAAMTRPMIAHRGRDMRELLASLAEPLRQLFRTKRQVVIGTCSATGFMEAAIRCGVRHRVLSLVGGAFGERFAAIGAACGRDVIRLNVAPGETVEPDMLRDALKHSDVDAVTLVHSETATGALAPLAELAKVVHEFDDVMLLVDAVTSAAGSPVETDEWGLDFVLTGSQKALALPPGLALGVCSARMLERAKTVPERGAYFDLVTFDEAFSEAQPTNTPAVSLFYALDAQLKRVAAEGGVEARWRRHDEMRKTVECWVQESGTRWGLSFVPVEGRRSWTTSCLRVPQGKSGRAIVQALLARGWTIGSGYGPLKESTIRIGHMGDHTPAGVRRLLDVLEDVLAGVMA